jgi:Cysteine rich repeat
MTIDQGVIAMKRLLIVPLLLLATPALAQQGAHSTQNKDACARDVSRFCRAKMSEGDTVVLGCLKDHRAKLGKACAKVLADNGQ